MPIAGSVLSFYRKWAAHDVYNIRPRITHIDHVIIRGYLHEHHAASATDHAQKQIQDPGLRRQWVLNDKLPSRLLMQPLPRELERKLSALPVGYKRVLVDDDVLLVNSAMRAIVDMMRNACATEGLGRCAARKRDHAWPLANRHVRVFKDEAARWRVYEQIATW